jgi:hypothetical protein
LVNRLKRGEGAENFGQFGKMPGALLGEDRLAVRHNVELALGARRDLGGVPGAVQFGRETRSPFVIAASDRAEQDAHLGHAPTLAGCQENGSVLSNQTRARSVGNLEREFVLAQPEDWCL